jgi:sugar lactone lactonase YvrE
MTVLAALLSTVALLLPPADPGPVDTLLSFDPTAGEFAENVAVGDDGTVVVSLSFSRTIRVLGRDGAQRTITLPLAAGGAVGGLVTGRGGTIYASSQGPAAIWAVDPHGAVSRLALLPPDAQPNGLTADRRGNLYAADSRSGTVWRLAPGSDTPEPWVRDELLAPSGATVPGPDGQEFAIPGANGVKVFLGTLYVANSSTARIVRVPIEPDGGAGTPEVAYDGVRADDFAFDICGNLYTATNVFGTVDRVLRDGTVETLLSPEDGVRGPSAVAFGRLLGPERTTLYIANLDLVGTPPRPSLQRVDVGIPGYPLAAPRS